MIYIFVVKWASLIKSLDVPLINVTIRDVSGPSRSSPRPMQPNPKPSFSDENNRYGCCWHGSLRACWFGRWCERHVTAYVDDTWQPMWTTHGSLRGWWRGSLRGNNDMAAYVDNNDVAAYMAMMMWKPTWPRPSSDYYSIPQGPSQNYNCSIKLAKKPIMTSL
jgi:hypothetical protein